MEVECSDSQVGWDCVARGTDRYKRKELAVDTVNVVVTCTKDKRYPVEPDCALRSLPAMTLRERAVEWRRRLSSRTRKRVPVDRLYAGDHWATVRSFESSRFKIDVWVCSAGYGLIRMCDSITPYSATFSSKHPDSVCRNILGTTNGDAPHQWWRQLTAWQGHTRGNPRSLRELAAAYPRRAMLVVASETYLKAVASDLLDAVGELSDSDLLSIVSAGSKRLPGLDDHLIPCDARLQPLVQGARRSLNTRVAGKILSEARVAPRKSTVARKFRKLLAEQPEIQKYDRSPMSDDEVREFIVVQLRRNANLCHTPLLRELRKSGRACEQSRFSGLYREVKEQLNGRT